MEPSPDNRWGTELANLFNKYCKDVNAECQASAIRVEAEFLFKNGKGELKMKTFTTPDTKTERMLDPDVPMPRGSKLQHDVVEKLRSMFTRVKRTLGGK